MHKKLLKYFGSYRRNAVLAPLLTAGEVIMEILIPFITAMIIDRGIEGGSMRDLVLFGCLMLVCAFVSLICGVLAGRNAAKASTGFACNLRQGMYEKIQEYSFSNIDKFSTAGLVTRMTTDVTNVQNAVQMILRIAVRAPLMLICSWSMCFIINRELSLVFFAAIIILGIILFSIANITMPIFQKVFNRYDDLNASVQENVGAIRTVKAYVREEYEKKKFSKASNKLYKMFVKAESILAFNNPVMMLVIYTCIVCISWFGAHFIVDGTMTTGNITSLFSYVISMMMSLMMLSMIFVMITMSSASIRRISQVLSEESDITDGQNPVMEVKDGSIDFSHVSFSYSSRNTKPVLEDINLHINAGETIGIIGATGSGKSSLVNLISRLYDISSGSLKVGGVEVRDYDIQTLRDAVAVVLQKNVLFSGTILENLRWGNENASEEECIEACKAACADEFIDRLPDGYNTYIEQGGTNVSGGQRQRLCIARSLLKKPKILILDDSTSAVDTATDAKIKKAFREKIGDTTKIIVSQRISSIEKADRIIVLDGGRVSGFDTHENLIRTNEIYREIVEAQSQGGGDFDHAKEE